MSSQAIVELRRGRKVFGDRKIFGLMASCNSHYLESSDWVVVDIKCISPALLLRPSSGNKGRYAYRTWHSLRKPKSAEQNTICFSVVDHISETSVDIIRYYCCAMNVAVNQPDISSTPNPTPYDDYALHPSLFHFMSISTIHPTPCAHETL